MPRIASIPNSSMPSVAVWTISVTRKINVRVIDFEYQQWPGFSPNGLSPYVITAGAAYTFH